MASAGVAVRRVCPGCKRKFSKPAQSSRKWCTRCRPPRVRPTGESLGEPAAAALGAPGEVERSLRAVLEDAGRAGRYQAVLALRLARQLDSGTSVAGAQGLASQIDSLMQAALDGVKPEPDFVDEMAERRAAVRGAG